MEQLWKKLQELSDQVGSDAAEGVEKFADELEKSIKELEESIDRALKDDRNHNWNELVMGGTCINYFAVKRKEKI